MKTYIKLLLTALFWGGTFVAGRIVTQDLAPFSIAFLRFAIASVFLLLLTWRIEGTLPGRGGPTWPPRACPEPVEGAGTRACPYKSQIIMLAALGMTGIFTYNVLFFKGLKLIEASRASLIVATCPVFIAVCSALFMKEKISLMKGLGVIISVCGAGVVVSKGSISEIFEGGLGRGELYILCCVLCWVAYSLIGKAAMKSLSPLVCVSYSSVIGTLALLIPAAFEGLMQNVRNASFVDWLCIFYLGVFGTVIGFVWYYQGVERLGPTKAGLFINFVPIFAILSALLILGESVTVSLAVGAAMVISGAYLTNRH